MAAHTETITVRTCDFCELDPEAPIRTRATDTCERCHMDMCDSHRRVIDVIVRRASLSCSDPERELTGRFCPYCTEVVTNAIVAAMQRKP